MKRGSTIHKESLPGQKLVKRRKIEDISIPESSLGESEPVVTKPPQESPVDKNDDTASLTSSDESDDDIELEQQRLKEMRDKRVRESAGAEDGIPSSDFDVLFRRKPIQKKSSVAIHNIKQNSESYKAFMKKIFK